MNIIETAQDPVKKIIFGREGGKDGMVLFSTGFSVDTATLKPASEWIKRGQLVKINRTTGYATLLKTAKIIAGGSASAPRVNKSHEVIVGDYLTDGYVVAEVTSVTVTEDDYDTLGLGSSLIVTAADTVLYSCASDAANTASKATGTVTEAATKTLKVDVAGANGCVVTIEQADDDVLAVAFSGGALTISLAKTTAANNTAELIQAAIRSLGTVGGIDFTDAVTTGTNWSSITGGTLGTATASFALGTPVVGIDPLPLPDGIVFSSVKKLGTPSVTVVAAGHEVMKDSLPYFVNDKITEGMKFFSFE